MRDEDVPNTLDWSNPEVRKAYKEKKLDELDYEPYYIYTRKYIGELKESTKTYIKTQRCTINEKTKALNYERFLGTLRNDTGIYYKESLFDRKGIEIAYKLPPDYKEKAYPGRDITQSDDGDIDILLEMLLRHEDTQIHEQIMKYFWNIYTGEDIYDIDIYELLDLFFENGFNKASSFGKLMLNGCTITKEEFIECVNNGTPANFSQYAEIIYDVCTANNINPILCVAQAGLETKYGKSVKGQAKQYNWWGINRRNIFFSR